MNLDLNGISVFVTVTEVGSFARAAEKLHLTRSAVGKTVARLEQKLGVLLFQRTTRKQSLTFEGSLFYEHCRRAMVEISLAEELLHSGQLKVSGRLRVSVPVLFGQMYIAPLLTELYEEHPLLQLEVSFMDRKSDLVEEGFDLAIRIGSLPDSSSLVARQLGKHKMVFCVSPSYLGLFGEPHSVEHLREHQVVGYTRSGRVQKWQVKDSEGKHRYIQPTARLMMDDLQAVANAAVNGKGIAWLPCWLVRQQLQQGTLVEVMSQCSEIFFPINAIWTQTLRLPLKVRLAVDKLVTKLPITMAIP